MAGWQNNSRSLASVVATLTIEGGLLVVLDHDDAPAGVPRFVAIASLRPLLPVPRSFVGISTAYRTLPQLELADRPPTAPGVELTAAVSELAAARAIVQRHGEDSISPFILRTDKAFHFAAGGVLAYRLIGATAVISGDPVAPHGRAAEVLASFLDAARGQGWRAVLYGASDRHLDGYERLGLRALCVGEEAIVAPDRFTLEGRAVRKLRQSEHRVQRRGWELTAVEGRAIGGELEAEIEALETAWRDGRRRLIGFAMAMGACEPEIRPDDIYLLARSPEGELRAMMRFIRHCGKLSLDTMRRVGETPNGLNEALVCRALELARERAIAEVSLNYAGLAHLVRYEPCGNIVRRGATRLTVSLLGRRFQMERLVRFNEKFSPDWRPRYLVYESRLGLPASVYRVLQAEGYISRRSGFHWPPRELPRLERRAASAPGRLGP